MANVDPYRPGRIYILRNPYLRDSVVKIGRTRRASELRAKELALATGVPAQFEVLYEEDVLDVKTAEQLIHQKLDSYRVNPKREFFLVPLKLAVRVVFETCMRINADHHGKAGARIALFLKGKLVTQSQALKIRSMFTAAPKGSASLYILVILDDRVVHIESNLPKVTLDAALLNSIRDLTGVVDIMVVHGKRGRKPLLSHRVTSSQP